jgi:lysyl-tRNA synthetase class 1
MYNKPREAKRLYFDVIPRAVDEYAQPSLAAYPKQADAKDRLMNPVWHIHGGKPPAPESGNVTFALLLNLATVANTEDKSVLWGFIQRYMPELSPETHPRLDKLVGLRMRYFHDFVKPKKLISSAHG